MLNEDSASDFDCPLTTWSARMQGFGVARPSPPGRVKVWAQNGPIGPCRSMGSTETIAA